MLIEEEVREALCEVGRRVWQRGFVASNDGNFSFRLSEDRVLCTPTLMSKGFLKPEDLVIVDMEGNQVAGRRRSTSEVRIHLYIYRERPDIHSVVHVHPPHATAFAIVRQDVPKCILQEVELFIGEIPRAPYATTGTWDFARTIAPWVRHHDCFLLTNHGAVTVGQDPFDAYYRMETLDQYCRILLLASQLGEWQKIDMAGIREMLQLKQRLGIIDKRSAAGSTLGDVCSSQVLPGGPEIIFPPYEPHRGPITDEPKLPPRLQLRENAPQRPIPAAAAPKADCGCGGATAGSGGDCGCSTPAQPDIRAIVEEVLRRIGR